MSVWQRGTTYFVGHHSHMYHKYIQQDQPKVGKLKNKIYVNRMPYRPIP